jgi:hypothetical protein
MGGQRAPLSIEEGVKGLVLLATLPDGGPTGRFFRFGTEVARTATSLTDYEAPF